MSEQFLRATQRELERLEQVLSRDVNFQRWKALQAVLATFRATEKAPAPWVINNNVVTVSGGSVPVVPTRSWTAPATESNAKQIQAAGIAYLRKTQKRAMSKELMQYMTSEGIEIKGEDKVAVVAAYMSALKGVVDNVRGEGYGLVEWSQLKIFVGAGEAHQ